MSRERHPCRCPYCPCPSAADETQPLCSSCTVGIHRPPQVIQDHLRRGIERWIELMPASLGSSGPSDRQMAIAHENWAAWHARQDCPAGCPWCSILAREAVPA